MYRLIAIGLLLSAFAAAQTTPTSTLPSRLSPPSISTAPTTLAKPAPFSIRQSSRWAENRTSPTPTAKKKAGTIRSITDARTAREFRIATTSSIPTAIVSKSSTRRTFFCSSGKSVTSRSKNKTDVVLIHNGDRGYEITYKGTAAQDKLDLENYLRRRQHSIEWVFRKWIRDPNVALFYKWLGGGGRQRDGRGHAAQQPERFSECLSRPEYALSGEDQLFVARPERQAEGYRR